MVDNVAKVLIILPFAIVAKAKDRLGIDAYILVSVLLLAIASVLPSVPIGHSYEGEWKEDLGLAAVFNSWCHGDSYEGDYKEGQKRVGFYKSQRC